MKVVDAIDQICLGQRLCRLEGPDQIFVLKHMWRRGGTIAPGEIFSLFRIHGKRSPVSLHPLSTRSIVGRRLWITDPPSHHSFSLVHQIPVNAILTEQGIDEVFAFERPKILDRFTDSDVADGDVKLTGNPDHDAAF